MENGRGVYWGASNSGYGGEKRTFDVILRKENWILGKGTSGRGNLSPLKTFEKGGNVRKGRKKKMRSCAEVGAEGLFIEGMPSVSGVAAREHPIGWSRDDPEDAALSKYRLQEG